MRAKKKTTAALPKKGNRRGTRSADSVAAHRVLRQFRIVFNAVKTHFRAVEKKAGLGGAQIWALSVVRDQPGIGISDLARAMDVRQPTASNLVRGLVDQQLIQVRPHEADRRAVKLYIRAQGARILQRAPQPFSGVLPRALASMDAAALARLEKDLAALIRVLGSDRRGATIPLGRM